MKVELSRKKSRDLDSSLGSLVLADDALSGRCFLIDRGTEGEAQAGAVMQELGTSTD